MSSNSQPKPPIARPPKLRQPAATEGIDAEPGKDTEFTAHMQLAYLESVVKDWQESQAANPKSKITPAAASEDEPIKVLFSAALFKNTRPGTVVKSLFAIAVALALGWLPAQRLLATTSAEAVVNARVITLRAPIEGEVTMANGSTDIGSVFGVDQDTVRNPRADLA